ncbi:uncharacterized protein LOC105205390 [Solenopsis invicta]|uniref:uncharacterized protein LOC105205390 n=1 Tax=Solenopsis invicta TaxID=13686 RepID=UPI000595E411|nr:uncharacterized protein LOC105205390 [Solenopsis invicta]
MSKDELSKLIVRGRIKAKLTAFSTYLERAATESVKIAELPIRLEKAEGFWQEFDITQSQIEDLENTVAQFTERENFENLYHAIITSARALQSRQDQANRPSSVNSVPERSVGNPQVNVFAQPVGPTKVKLPNIELPKFDGSYNKWIPFRELFESLIDANAALPAIQKLHYLKLALTHEAAKVIQSLELSNANYEIAWDLLKQRYENKRLIVHHMQELLDLAPIVKESHAALRQFIDGISQHIQPLIKLGQPVEHWNTILIHIFTPKLDKITKREWELKRATIDTFPTLNEFIEFLNTRSAFLESLSYSANNTNSVSSVNKSHNKAVICACVSEEKSSCPVYQGNHELPDCGTFRKWSAAEHMTEIKKRRLCIRCLKNFHGRNCKASECKRCKGYHHTMLHLEKTIKPDKEANQTEPSTGATKTSATDKQIVATVTQAPTTTLMHCATKGPLQVMLATAIIYIKDQKGILHECRAFLDSGSHSNFITCKLSDRLQLLKQQTTMTITAINEIPVKTSQQITATIQSRYNAFQATLPFFTIPKITKRLPLNKVDLRKVEIPERIQLADPEFHIPATIDILLGASVFWDLLYVGQIKIFKQQPTFRKTQLGWIVAGAMELHHMPTTMTTYCGFSSERTLCDQLQKFWQIEEITSSRHLSQEETTCEKHFTDTIRRTEDGRFVVQLPLKRNPSKLGDSYEIARKRFQSIERKLNKDPTLKKEYHAFIQEYLQLGRMSEVEERDSTVKQAICRIMR